MGHPRADRRSDHSRILPRTVRIPHGLAGPPWRLLRPPADLPARHHRKRRKKPAGEHRRGNHLPWAATGINADWSDFPGRLVQEKDRNFDKWADLSHACHVGARLHRGKSAHAKSAGIMGVPQAERPTVTEPALGGVESCRVVYDGGALMGGCLRLGLHSCVEQVPGPEAYGCCCVGLSLA